MKTTDSFKNTIEKYLKMRAFQDPLFAKTLEKENKNLDDCITYILNTVKKSGSNGFDDDEIYNMAVHYFDEDDIKVTEGDSRMKVVVNHKVKLTIEERAKAKQDAIDSVISEEKAKMRKKPVKPVKPVSGETDKAEAPKENTLF